MGKYFFNIQYQKEISAGGVNIGWIKDLQEMIDKINDAKTRLIGLPTYLDNEIIKLDNPIKQKSINIRIYPR